MFKVYLGKRSLCLISYWFRKNKKTVHTADLPWIHIRRQWLLFQSKVNYFLTISLLPTEAWLVHSRCFGLYKRVVLVQGWPAPVLQGRRYCFITSDSDQLVLIRLGQNLTCVSGDSSIFSQVCLSRETRGEKDLEDRHWTSAVSYIYGFYAFCNQSRIKIHYLHATQLVWSCDEDLCFHVTVSQLHSLGPFTPAFMLESESICSESLLCLVNCECTNESVRQLWPGVRAYSPT